MLPNTTRNAFSQGLIDWSLNFKKKKKTGYSLKLPRSLTNNSNGVFPKLVIPRVVCLQEWSQEEH